MTPPSHPTIEVALGIFLVAGALNSGLNVAAGPMMMRETPNDMMGRVMSIFQPAMSLAILVSTAAVGYLAGVMLHGFHARWLGMSFAAVDTIYLVGGALVALSGLALVIGLRGIDRREDRAAAEAARAAEVAIVTPAAMSTSAPA